MADFGSHDKHATQQQDLQLSPVLVALRTKSTAHRAISVPVLGSRLGRLPRVSRGSLGTACLGLYLGARQKATIAR